MVSGNAAAGGGADCAVKPRKLLEDAKLPHRQHLRVSEGQCRCFAQLQESIIRQSTKCGFIDVMQSANRLFALLRS